MVILQLCVVYGTPFSKLLILSGFREEGDMKYRPGVLQGSKESDVYLATNNNHKTKNSKCVVRMWNNWKKFVHH